MLSPALEMLSGAFQPAVSAVSHWWLMFRDTVSVVCSTTYSGVHSRCARRQWPAAIEVAQWFRVLIAVPQGAACMRMASFCMNLLGWSVNWVSVTSSLKLKWCFCLLCRFGKAFESLPGCWGTACWRHWKWTGSWSCPVEGGDPAGSS